jgi:putative ABC transport system substrate-binding protein
LLPRAVHVALLLNPANVITAETTLREAQQAATALGFQIQRFNATTIAEIEMAFASFTQERVDALFVSNETFFSSRRVQFATLAAVHKIPAAYSNRDFVAAGGLMSYGTDVADRYHQLGVYTGNILNGAKPSDLPVVQSSKFEFAINMQTARALGIDVPSGVLAIADEVID